MSINQSLQLAIIHFNAGRLHEAENLYHAILQEQPNHPDANYNLGLLAGQMGKLDLGLAYLQRAWESEPTNEIICLTLAECLLNLDRSSDALRIIKDTMQLSELNDQKAEYLQQLATSIVTGERPEISIEAEFCDLFNAGHYAALEGQLTPLMKKFPNWPAGWHLKGITLLAQNKDGETELRSAVSLNPNDAAYHSSLAQQLFQKGDLVKAISSFQAVVKLQPDLKEAHHNLSKLLFETKSFDDAKHSYHASVPDVSIDQISVCDILGVKEFCCKTGSPYQLVQPAHSISVAMPKYIGVKFGAATGVTESNELYVAELSQAKILAKHSIVILNQNTVLNDNLVHPLGNSVDLRFELAVKSQAHKKIMIDQSAFKTVHAERGIHLSGPSTFVYGHWVFEHLPKIKLFDAVPKYNTYPVYVDAAMPASHYQALELLTQGKRKVIPIESDTSVEFDKLVVAPTFTFIPFSTKPNTPVNIHIAPASQEAAMFLRERILSALNLNADRIPSKQHGRRIFIGRKHTGRTLINQVEIQELLSSYGFEVIYPEEHTFDQQVKIFNEAEYVFGPNGSAFSNVIFCKKGSKIVSFVQSYGSNFSSWPQVLEQLGLRHLYVAGHAISESSWHEHHFDYVVPIPLVKQALEYYGLRISPS